MVSVKRLLAITALLALSACTVVPMEEARTTEPVQTTEVKTKPQDALIVPQQPKSSLQASEPAKSLPAATRIRQLASAEGEKGDYKRAIALLERALRISPRDPETYYELARHYLLMEEPAQALQLAQRGLSLKPSLDQRHRLEQLVDDCRAKLTV